MPVLFLESGKILKEISSMFRSRNVNEIDIAVAYLSRLGYESIRNDMVGFLKRNGRVRMLIGLSDKYFTESSALKALLKQARKYKKLELRYQNPSNAEFHPKLLLARSKGEFREAIVGSSNLTGGGQKRNIEANIAVKMPESGGRFYVQLKNDLTRFFAFFWLSGKKLDSSTIEIYRHGEKERKKAVKKAKPRSVVERTRINFIYVDDERELCNSLRVHCTRCKSEYIPIPVNAFYCEDCSSEPFVSFPSPSRKEREKKHEIDRIKVEVDGKAKSVEEIALRCPDCSEPLDFTDDFFLWIVCPRCADQLRRDDITICKPFRKWQSKKARKLQYRINQERLIIDAR
jgi:HKD family nuclease